jgi:predicted GIY-YIG superfamily endonuclease
MWLGGQLFKKVRDHPHITRGGFQTTLIEWASNCEVCREAYSNLAKPGGKPSKRCLKHRRGRAASEPSWMPMARIISRLVTSRTSTAPRASHKVYVVLLEDEAGGRSGVYVGLTGKTPEERFKQHKAGIKAGKKYVYRYGTRLLPDLYQHLNPMTLDEAREIEARLKTALEVVVPWAEGGH